MPTKLTGWYYNNVTWASCHLKSLVTILFIQQLVRLTMHDVIIIPTQFYHFILCSTVSNENIGIISLICTCHILTFNLCHKFFEGFFYVLRHWGWDQIIVILQATFSISAIWQFYEISFSYFDANVIEFSSYKNKAALIHVIACHYVKYNMPGAFFTNPSWALKNILSKFVYCRNHTLDENLKLKLCTCAHSMALGTHTKFQLEILTISVIPGIAYFCMIVLESSWNVSETTPSSLMHLCIVKPQWVMLFHHFFLYQHSLPWWYMRVMASQITSNSCMF